MSDLWVLVDKIPVPCPNFSEYIRWLRSFKEDGFPPRVDSSFIGQFHVSTIFIGMAYILFETAVFDEENFLFIHKRTSTWAEAELAHAEAVQKMSRIINAEECDDIAF